MAWETDGWPPNATPSAPADEQMKNLPPFPVVDLVMDLLRVDPSGDQSYLFRADYEAVIARLLDALFVYPDDPRTGVDTLIRFICALELELASPRTADQLRAVLRSDPRVVALCDVAGLRDPEVSAVQARWSGAQESKQAPRYGAGVPSGMITAASLLDPGRGAARGTPTPKRSR
jgi:hypothetical protein